MPDATPETADWWEGCAVGELRLPTCGACGTVSFPPRARCPQCGGSEWGHTVASGRATLHSYVISHRAAAGLTPPFSIAVVQLDEGPRLLSNVVDVDQTPEALRIDMALEVVFTPGEDGTPLPRFRPAGGAP